MSMISECRKMKPVVNVDDLSNFKFKVGDEVRHVVNTPKFGVCRLKYGVIEACRTKYCRRFYDVRLEGSKNLKTIIETELTSIKDPI